jgi:TP901 family phage tail tape measure protein
MNETLTVQVNADTQQFDRGIGGVVQRLGGAGPAALAGAAVAAGAAMAAMVGKGLQEFGRLEQGMNEVFTLMPGMSEDAMSDMTDDVQAFAREVGITTDEVVPALYSSISAGVPADNVFTFLETANQLAVGGVADLETSVDALSSAVNAYGEEFLSTEEAADFMFTAVRQGKTTIDELADSVSTTAPIAASLGIGFDEVQAALAAMTSQGEPTASAATKIRQAMAELSTEGTKAFTAFEDAAGQTFPDFIASGGTIGEAFVLMSDHAESMGGRVADSFSSVEAGMAATMLSSDSGAEQFDANMVEMGNSAGATQAAFDQMDQGIQRNWERLTANLQTFLGELGERFAPAVERVLIAAVGFFDTFTTGVLNAIDTVTGMWETGVAGMQDTSNTRLAAMQELWNAFVAALTALFDLMVGLYVNVLKPAWDAMTPWLTALLDALIVVVDGAVAMWTDAFNMFAAFLSGDFTGAWEAFESMVTGIKDTLVKVVETLVTGWRKSFETIKSYFEGAFKGAIESATSAIETAFDNLRDRATSAMDSLFGGLGGLARKGLEGIHSAFEWLSGAVKTVWTGMTSAVENLASGLAVKVQDAFGNAAQWLVDKMNVVIDAINGAIERLNRALEIDIPDVRFTIPDYVPMVGGREVHIRTPNIDPPDIDPIPRLAEGGFVDQATLAIIGEAGPEAVVPLDRLGSMTGSQTIIVELDGRRIAESTVRHAPSVLRLHGA